MDVEGGSTKGDTSKHNKHSQPGAVIRMALNFLKKHLKQFSSNQTCCPGGSLLLVGTCLKCHLEPLLISITLMMVKMIGMAMIVLIPARVALNIVLPKLVQPVWKIC